MVALKGGDIDRFVKKPDRRFSVVLVYGPDAGLVHERCRSIARSLVDDPDDAFQLIRMDGDDLGGDTSRIVDEPIRLGFLEVAGLSGFVLALAKSIQPLSRCLLQSRKIQS